MVQKGYGWMLKETSKPYQKEVFDFVMKTQSCHAADCAEVRH